MRLAISTTISENANAFNDFSTITPASMFSAPERPLPNNSSENNSAPVDITGKPLEENPRIVDAVGKALDRDPRIIRADVTGQPIDRDTGVVGIASRSTHSTRDPKIIIPDSVQRAQKERERLAAAIERKEIDVQHTEEVRAVNWADALQMPEVGILFTLERNPRGIIDKVFSSLNLPTFHNYNHYITHGDSAFLGIDNAISPKQLDEIFDKLQDFYDKYLRNAPAARVDFLERIYFLRKYLQLKTQEREAAISIPDGFLDFLVDEFIATDNDALTDRYLMQLLLVESDRISAEHARKIIRALDEQNQCSCDLAQTIFAKFPALRNAVSENTIPENEADPYREIPNTKIGIELEFKLAGRKQEQQDFVHDVLERYRDILYSSGGRILWQDQGVAEIAIGGDAGISMSRDLTKKLRSLIREIEKHPAFIAWGSTHIHVDAKAGIGPDNSLFLFSDYNDDGKGFETKDIHLASYGKINQNDYILDVTTLLDQVRILSALYEKEPDDNVVDIAKEAILSGRDVNDARGRILRLLCQDHEQMLPALERLHNRNAIPLINDIAICKKIDSLPGTVEVIDAIARIEDWWVRVILTDKIDSLPGTVEVIDAIAQVEDWRGQEVLVDKIDSLPGTVEVITAIARIEDVGVQGILANKVVREGSFDEIFNDAVEEMSQRDKLILHALFYPDRSITGTVEVITAIAQVEDWRVQEVLADKIDTLPGTVEVITAIAQVEKRMTQKILAGKIMQGEDFDNVFNNAVEKMSQRDKLILHALFYPDRSITGTVEVITAIAQVEDWRVQEVLADKIDTLPGTVEVIDAIARVEDWWAQWILANKICSLPGTVEVITAIAQVEDWRVQEVLADKIDTLPGTVEVITAIAQVEKRMTQKILAGKVQRGENFDKVFDMAIKNMPEENRRVLQSVFY